MRTARQITEEAAQTGMIRICGEMEIPTHCTISEAHHIATKIASSCGYLVTKKGSHNIEICGGELTGYAELEWYNADERGPQRITLWHEDYAWFK